MEPRFSSMLLLELEELKDSMMNVLAEVGMCMTSLESQHLKVNDALARLDIVTAIAKAKTVNDDITDVTFRAECESVEVDDTEKITKKIDSEIENYEDVQSYGRVVQRVDDIQSQLKNEKERVKRKDIQIETDRSFIQKLNLRIASLNDVIPSTMNLVDVVKLHFKEEDDRSSNYPMCLRKFLQSEDLMKVEEVEGEIIFTFSSSNKLESLLNSKCKKTVQKWSDISKLPLRAGFVSDKLTKSYGLMVHFEEVSLISKPIKQVEDELKASQARVECRKYGFAARFPTLLSFFQVLANRELYSHHRVMFMLENLLFMGKTEAHKFFKGTVCLTEDDMLRMLWKRDKVEPPLEHFLAGLSAFLLDPRVSGVSEDWNGRLVLNFDSEQMLESILLDHCSTESESVTKLTRLPVNFSLTGCGLAYSIRCPPGVDYRHFFMIDNSCYISQHPSVKISSPSRLFPFVCLTSSHLRLCYPSLCLHSDDFQSV